MKPRTEPLTPRRDDNPNKVVAHRVPLRARSADAETASRSDLVKDRTIHDPRCLPSRRARNPNSEPSHVSRLRHRDRIRDERSRARVAIPSLVKGLEKATELARPPSTTTFARESSCHRFSGPRTPPRDFCTHSRPRGHNLFPNGGLHLRINENASTRLPPAHFKARGKPANHGFFDCAINAIDPPRAEHRERRPTPLHFFE